jgi:hypothetical protein
MHTADPIETQELLKKSEARERKNISKLMSECCMTGEEDL